MPFALLIVGIVLVVAAVRNTQSQLYGLVKGDFTGPNNYLYWLVSILIIGAVGYVPTLKPISRMFLVLLIVVLFLSHGGVLQQLNAQLFSASPSVSNQPISLGGLPATFSGNLADLWKNVWPSDIEQPIAPARPNQ